MAGRPARQSADKSQHEFLMQSPQGYWMLLRRHRVVFFSVACPVTSNQFFMDFWRFIMQFLTSAPYEVSCWGEELKHEALKCFLGHFCFLFLGQSAVLARHVCFHCNLPEVVSISLHLLLSTSQLWSHTQSLLLFVSQQCNSVCCYFGTQHAL